MGQTKSRDWNPHWGISTLIDWSPTNWTKVVCWSSLGIHENCQKPFNFPEVRVWMLIKLFKILLPHISFAPRDWQNWWPLDGFIFASKFLRSLQNFFRNKFLLDKCFHGFIDTDTRVRQYRLVTNYKCFQDSTKGRPGPSPKKTFTVSPDTIIEYEYCEVYNYYN